MGVPSGVEVERPPPVTGGLSGPSISRDSLVHPLAVRQPLHAKSPGVPVALFPGGWIRAPLVVSCPRTSQTQPVCLQTLLSKYTQQYHKLFKDIPAEEVVLKGERSPWYAWTGALRCPSPRSCPLGSPRHNSEM